MQLASVSLPIGRRISTFHRRTAISIPKQFELTYSTLNVQRSFSIRAIPHPKALPHSHVSLRSQPTVFHRSFHASIRRQIGPAPFIAAGALLKSSAFLTVATTVARVLFTLVPFQVFARLKFVKKLHRHAANYPKDISPEAQAFYDMYCVRERPEIVRFKGCSDDKKRIERLGQCQMDSLANTGLTPEQGKDLVRVDGDTHNLRMEGFGLPPLPSGALTKLESLTVDQRRDLYRLRRYETKQNWISTRATFLTRMLAIFLICPILLVGLSALFSLERVPYTGRWRLIMLSPEEEDVITSRLSGPGWFAAVIKLLTTPDAPAPPVVPMDDWRWSWVNQVMRRLESAVIARCAQGPAEALKPATTIVVDGETRQISFPPPPLPKHPLHPRARAASSLHSALPGGHPDSGMSHLAVGPPYSLLLLEKDEENALSYGFGQGGAGGIVVFTGILDEILKNGNEESVMEELPPPPAPPPPPPPTLLQSLFGFKTQIPAPSPRTIAAHPEPTETQTLQLATVLAHELSHLLLSHHLEAVSSTQVLLPSMFSIFGDLFRAVIFPFTMMFGPFVNDAIANMSKAGVSGSTLLGDYQFSKLHEKEADIVALRILSYAGYDPNAAVKTWSTISNQTCQSNDPASNTADYTARSAWSMFRGGVHADADARYQAAKKELDRWEKEARQLGLKPPATLQENT